MRSCSFAGLAGSPATAQDFELAISNYTAVLKSGIHRILKSSGKRGDAYFSKKDYGRAIEDYTTVLRFAPGEAVALHHRGKA